MTEWAPTIDRSYFDAFGVEHRVPEATLRALTEAMGEPTGSGPRFVRAGESADIRPGVIALEDGGTVEVTTHPRPGLPRGYHPLPAPDRARYPLLPPL